MSPEVHMCKGSQCHLLSGRHFVGPRAAGIFGGLSGSEAGREEEEEVTSVHTYVFICTYSREICGTKHITSKPKIRNENTYLRII